MKTLYIITQADGGGAQKYVLSLAKHFGGIIAAGDEASKLFDDAKALGLTTYSLRHLKRNINPYHDLMAVWEIRGLIKALQPDIVHLNSSKAGFLGSLAGMFLKSKIVFTAHGFIFNEPMPLWKKNFYIVLEKVASDFRDFIITVYGADKKSALDNKLITENKIQTIHNGLSAITFLTADEAKTKLGLNKSKFIIGTVAGFYKTKGLDILIDSAGMLDKNVLSKIQFAILGRGPEFESCKLKIINLNLSDFFYLPGFIEDASCYLKAFDVFVLPSRKEGQSYALIEAMQAGLPIIASNVGGNHEALDSAGMLIKPEDTNALHRAIEIFMEDKNLRQELGQKALERANLFTEEKMLNETENIYKLLLNKGSV